jgi:hypothetical protein
MLLALWTTSPKAFYHNTAPLVTYIHACPGKLTSGWRGTTRWFIFGALHSGGIYFGLCLDMVMFCHLDTWVFNSYRAISTRIIHAFLIHASFPFFKSLALYHFTITRIMADVSGNRTWTGISCVHLMMVYAYCKNMKYLHIGW